MSLTGKMLDAGQALGGNNSLLAALARPLRPRETARVGFGDVYGRATGQMLQGLDPAKRDV